MVNKPILLVSNTKHYIFKREGFNLDILVAHPFYNFCPKLFGIAGSYKDMFERFVYFPAKRTEWR